MVEINKLSSCEQEKELIRKMMEDLSVKLKSHYGGGLVVGLYEGWREDVTPVQPELWYVGEETTRYILGIFPKIEIKSIVGVQSGFSGGAYGRKDLEVWLVRGRLTPEAESDLEKHIKEFAEQNQVTNVNMQTITMRG